MKRFLLSFGYWLGTLLLWELSLYWTACSGIVRFLPGLCLTAAYAGLVTLLVNLPGWTGRVCGWVFPPIMLLVYLVQLVYYEVFGSFLSVAFVAAGGDAVTTYYTIVLGAIWRRLPQILLMIAPLVGFYILRKLELLPRWGLSWGKLGILAGVSVLTATVTLTTLPLYGTDSNQPSALLKNPATSIDRWMEHFGVLTAEVLDLSRQGGGGTPVFAWISALGEVDPTEEYNILPELDFAKLDTLTEDEALKSLNGYFASLSGTKKNKYTGKFADHNLIVVCAEGFSNYVIDPELTPTLYKLSTEGFVFENFYNSFPNLTTNGEYSLCMGLMPDLSRMSFAVSVENYLPYALGNIARENGMTALAYHNNVGTFYNRINTHGNMGYDFRAVDHGLSMEAGSPSSDLEMMQVSVEDYLEKEPFHAYYMTYSGHADYDFTTNEMSVKNQDLVADLPYSEPVRAYIACQLELEKAMAYLLERLETAGIADRTLVVLTGDHMPYGLPEEAYRELAGDEAVSQPYWQYRNSFICWSGSMDKPVVVEDYCCTQDILPTILNLMGIPYDSRLLTGQDVLSDGDHLALLKDGSFLSKDLIYDGNTGNMVWTGKEQPELAERLKAQASNCFSASAAILATDYYDFAFRSLNLSTGRQERELHNSYADVAGAWYEQAVTVLTSYGALSGNSTGAFNGDHPASRADFVAMVTRSLGLVGSSTGSLPYGDVEQGAWYADALSAALEAGFIKNAKKFRPTEAITQTEAQLILSRAKEGEWVETAIKDAVRKQNEVGYTGLANTLSRGAVAYLVAEMVDPEAVDSPTFAPPEPQPVWTPPAPEPAPEPEIPEEPKIPAPDPLAPPME